MSCNGCRVLRKGCSENCMLRQCLQCIESPQAQAHATVFVAKFFGRACLLSFLSSVPLAHRPALFQSLLYEACGRTVNPVTGAVGLLWTGNWHLCESAVETVLRGGTPTPAPGIFAGFPTSDEVSVVDAGPSIPGKKRKVVDNDVASRAPCDLDLRLTASRGVSPSRQSEESVTTSLETGMMREREEDGKLLLFL